MRVLYAVQGTGYGHISRATEIIPILKEKCDLEVLISGHSSTAELPFKVDYEKVGVTFYNGKNGGIDYVKTFRKLNFIRLFKEVVQFNTKNFDLVISDFEPVSAWSAKINNVPSVELSHQAAVIHPYAPKAKEQSKMGEFILKNLAPTKTKIGFHFAAYDQSIYTPVIRQEIRDSNPMENDYILVYLPSYHPDFLTSYFRKFPNTNFVIFSSACKDKYTHENSTVYPISPSAFTLSLINCGGVICGAGFETPAEALFLNKKLLVIPIKQQYEQLCNARALQKLGVTVLEDLDRYSYFKIQNWLEYAKQIRVYYPNQTEKIITQVLNKTNVNTPTQQNLVMALN